MVKIALKVLWNADDAHLVWTHEHDIPNCLGFAIQCRRGDQPPIFISNRVGFEDEQIAGVDGEAPITRSSAQWPFQRYDWTDHAADLGDEIRYRVVARVVGDDGALQNGPTSDWSPLIKLSADCGDGVSVHFNRGFVLSQFMARYMRRKNISLAKLKETAVVVSQDVDREARAFLGGTLREAMLEMMNEVRNDEGLELHAALYELIDAELVEALAALKDRAHVVLANGSVEKRGDDQNDVARAALIQAGCAVHHRFLAPDGLAHNKFVVIGRRDGATFKPLKVWTGSTNWTPTGLCTQLNNGIMIENAAAAARFEEQFQLLAGAGDGFPDELLYANNRDERRFALGQAELDVWFTKIGHQVDIEELKRLIGQAREGILFVMFQPGSEPVKTLLDMQAEKHLYVRGVATQLTGAGREEFKLLKKNPETYFLDTAQATGVATSVGGWAVEATAAQFKSHIGHAITHSKTIVIDPFSDDPIVVTGSHNFSKAASMDNDENFVVVRGHKSIAMHYAVNAMQTYNHYRWRAYLEEAKKENRKPYQHLSRNPDWQNRRKQGETQRMLAFFRPA